MEKINLYDKFFHSPNWNTNLISCSIERLRDILKSGYILSAEQLGKISGYNEPYKPNRVYFSVHPDSEFASSYHGDKHYTDFETAYVMTLKGQYFILDRQLKEDYRLSPGAYDCECTVLNGVKLDKYLVGIGNAGFSVDDFLVISFNLIRYYKGEITEEELTNIVRERTLIATGDIDRFMDYSYNGISCYNHFVALTRNEIDHFIEVENYPKVARILDEENRNIPLYDKYGFRVNPEESKKEIKRMLKYISSNLRLLKKDEFAYAMRELKERLRENVKTFKK